MENVEIIGILAYPKIVSDIILFPPSAQKVNKKHIFWIWYFHALLFELSWHVLHIMILHSLQHYLLKVTYRDPFS
jgi:hypothetical protein